MKPQLIVYASDVFDTTLKIDVFTGERLQWLQFGLNIQVSLGPVINRLATDQ